MINRLPIVNIFLEALAYPCKHVKLLPKVGFPFIVLGFVYLLFGHFYPDFVQHGFVYPDPYHPENTAEESSTSLGSNVFFLAVAYVIAFWIAVIMAIIACHRLILLGSKSIRESSLLNWTGNEIPFIGWQIRIGIGVALFTIPFFIAGIALSVHLLPVLEKSFNTPARRFLVELIIELPILYLVSRWSLVLPSAAIGKHGRSLTWSWHQSKGNGWRLTILIGLIPYLTSYMFTLFVNDNESLLLNLARGVIWLLVGVIQVGMLSLSYRHLVENDKHIEQPNAHSVSEFVSGNHSLDQKG